MMTSKPSSVLLPLALAAAFSSCTAVGEETQDDLALAHALDNRVSARNGVVSSAHPLASEAGVEVLRRGGNAVDAAIATGFAINVVEPMMSGVGGGGSMVLWLQDEERAEYVDFYSAQRAATWLRPLPDTGSASLRGVGVPGAVAGFVEAHERHGALSLAEVMAPAIRLAEEGFPVYLVLHDAIEANRPKIERFPETAERFLPGGAPLAVGEIFRQPELGRTFRRIAAEGREGFYGGEIGEALVRALNAGGNPVTAEDLLGYAAQWDKRPLCTEYRGKVVLSAAPPQTGMRVLEALNLLERHDLPAMPLPTRSAEALDLLASALRVAQVDHGSHNGDPNWMHVPASGVASKAFAAERGSLVGARPVAERVEAGDAGAHDNSAPSPACAALDPYGVARTVPAANSDDPLARESPEGETTHISAVDRDGNAVALTNTLSPYFGSGAWVEGFMLNSSGVDFTTQDPRAPALSEWRVRPSTIAPTIVLEDGRVRAVVGTPGGGRIPGAIVQTLVYMLDYRLDPFEAVAMPRILASPRNRRIELEHGFRGPLLSDIRDLGWEPVSQSPGYARLYVIGRVGDRWVGAADPRHDGGAAGY